MSDSLAFTDSERRQLAAALQLLASKLTNTSATPPTTSPSGQSTPAAAPAPLEKRDRWAKDRSGNELANPEGSVAREVNIWKVEQKTGKPPKKVPYVKVTWQSQERGYVDANCAAKELFQWLIAAQGSRTTLYLVKNGQYLNIVGVRA